MTALWASEGFLRPSTDKDEISRGIMEEYYGMGVIR